MSKRQSPIIVVQRDKLNSKAWLSLGGKAPQVYMIFLQRRKIQKMGRKGHEQKVCINEKELIFTYKEAEKKYGLTKRTFGRAIDQLIDRGFLYIVEPGGSLFRNPTIYGLSERWRKYGTEEFVHQERNKRNMKVGFCGPRLKSNVQKCPPA